MGIILREDDLKVGMFITVHSLKIFPVFDKNDDENLTCFSPPEEEKEDIRKRDKGRVFKIVSINLPYIACSYCLEGGRTVYKKTLDIRELQLMRITKKFAEELSPEIFK